MNLTVGAFAGGGTLSADGGRGAANDAVYRGGAGRIKVTYTSYSFAGTYAVQMGDRTPMAPSTYSTAP